MTFKIKYQFGSKPTFLGHDVGSFGGEKKSNQANRKAAYSTIFGEKTVTSLTSKNQFENTMGFTDHALEQDQQLRGDTGSLLRTVC